MGTIPQADILRANLRYESREYRRAMALRRLSSSLADDIFADVIQTARKESLVIVVTRERFGGICHISVRRLRVHTRSESQISGPMQQACNHINSTEATIKKVSKDVAFLGFPIKRGLQE